MRDMGKMRDRQLVIVISARLQKLLLATGLIILVLAGTVAILTHPVEVFRDIRTPFEIDYTSNIQAIMLVFENGTSIRGTIGGYSGDPPGGVRAHFDAPVLFHFHGYAPFYDQSAIYDAWTTVGNNKLTFRITFTNQTTITYSHRVRDGLAYTPLPYGGPYYFHVNGLYF
jgi:hypothetical protein